MLNIQCIDNELGMTLLEDKSVQLIIADPPYFEVNGEFDFVFAGRKDWLNTLEAQAKAYQRILSPNGTLAIYGHHLRIGYVQVLFDKYFSLLNHIVWENMNQYKQNGRLRANGRKFPSMTERLLLYEHREGAGKRFFRNTEYLGDVWRFANNDTCPNIHPTIKPENMTQYLIEATTNVGDTVLVPYVGSGTECAVAHRLGRNFVGFDTCKAYCDFAKYRIESGLTMQQIIALRQPSRKKYQRK